MAQLQPLIVTGPAGSGKSYWIQEYAKAQRKQLLTCPCRKDRTLREGRQKLHIWGRRLEPVVLWLEGADDLTPEAQAFLRRILETHATDVQFILECRDSGKLQEPIRSRCALRRISMPTRAELEVVVQAYKGVDRESIFTYLQPDEYSYRRLKHCIFLQLQHPALWAQTIENRRENLKEPKREDVLKYFQQGMNPELYIQYLLDRRPELLGPYGECLELSGSMWAFLAAAL